MSIKNKLSSEMYDSSASAIYSNIDSYKPNLKFQRLLMEMPANFLVSEVFYRFKSSARQHGCEKQTMPPLHVKFRGANIKVLKEVFFFWGGGGRYGNRGTYVNKQQNKAWYNEQAM